MNYSFIINRYHFEKINGEPKIVIDQIKVLDENGKYIKFAKLEKVIDHLCSHNVNFRNFKL